MSFWILLPGILGGRLAYLFQYSDKVFTGKGGAEWLFAAVNLSEGGLVLMGAMVGGGVGFFAFCHRRKINPLKLADVVVPSAFIGVGFGRIGCLLNGCCFGDACSLPWAITFPNGSVPFGVMAYRGFIDPAAAATMPVHPTQIYSSINAFILAFVTATYFYRRRHVGDVFALALILYPITRFTIEFLRNDEFGQLGTGLTISQIYSLVMCAAGIGLYAWLNRRGREAVTATSVIAPGA
jgi:phosphatidylglycerol:prolipoprotein diacylglycerol transferase